MRAVWEGKMYDWAGMCWQVEMLGARGLETLVTLGQCFESSDKPSRGILGASPEMDRLYGDYRGAW
jgi:hypothetical protein